MNVIAVLIAVLLKQRHDELPKLIEACKRCIQYEQETLERVLRARGAVQAARSGIDPLFALVENYPQLKADESFRPLQTRITDLLVRLLSS